MIPKKLLVIISFIFINTFPVLLFGQCNEFKDSIDIVTLDYDTLSGYGKEMDNLFLDGKYDFEFWIKENENCKGRIISVDKIHQIIYKNESYFHKLTGKFSGYHFLKMKYDGIVKYYSGTYSYFMADPLSTVSGGSLTEEEYHYVEINKKVIKLKKHKNKFPKKILEIFGNCPEIKENIGNYKIEDLEKIVKIYCNWSIKNDE